MNTFAYDLSAYFANILSLLTSCSNFMLPKSALFVSPVSDRMIQEREIMVSFDVELLFTNIPLNAAVKTARQKLENNPSLPRGRGMYQANIFQLLCVYGLL